MPEIGQIVTYREGTLPPNEAYRGQNGTLFHPAIITRIWSPTCVNLMVFFDCALPTARTSVSELPVLPIGVEDTSGNACWFRPEPPQLGVITAAEVLSQPPATPYPSATPYSSLHEGTEAGQSAAEGGAAEGGAAEGAAERG